MKILICSYAFYPSFGGIESTAELLAAGFVNEGHEVRLVTHTPQGRQYRKFTFEVIRNPRPLKLLQLVLWSDLVFHNNISLNFAWPLIFIRRPWVITHQTWLKGKDAEFSWNDKIKRFALRFAINIAVSQAVADDLNVTYEIIANPYDNNVFCRLKDTRRNKELIFAGRLVSDKGVDTLLNALKLLKVRGYLSALTIVGDGPERNNLELFSKNLGIDTQVDFLGFKNSPELVKLFNTHKILVVPSLWNEPFGSVAIEAIACGCVVVGSSGGGLPSAIGPCGLTFPNGDARALADKLVMLFSNEKLLASFVNNTDSHALKHTVSLITKRYLDIFNKAVKH